MRHFRASSRREGEPADPVDPEKHGSIRTADQQAADAAREFEDDDGEHHEIDGSGCHVRLSFVVDRKAEDAPTPGPSLEFEGGVSFPFFRSLLKLKSFGSIPLHRLRGGDREELLRLPHPS
ncbi:MAG: hypothetical protein R2849_03765 [Thermomicrobiales bacterium]